VVLEEEDEGVLGRIAAYRGQGVHYNIEVEVEVNVQYVELWTVLRRTAGEGSEDHTAWVGVHPGQRLVNTPIVPGTVPLFLPQHTVLCKPLVRALIAEKPPQPIGYLGKPEGDSRLGSRAHPGLCRGSACLTSLNNCSQETVSYETGLRGCELSGS